MIRDSKQSLKCIACHLQNDPLIPSHLGITFFHSPEHLLSFAQDVLVPLSIKRDAEGRKGCRLLGIMHTGALEYFHFLAEIINRSSINWFLYSRRVVCRCIAPIGLGRDN